jgi:uncharacterized protein YjbI with pentapeptide repeats
MTDETLLSRSRQILSLSLYSILNHFKATRTRVLKRVRWVDTRIRGEENIFIARWWQIIRPHYKKLLLAVCVGVPAVVSIILIPQRQVAPWQNKLENYKNHPDLEIKEYLKLENDARKLENDARTALIQAVGGLLVLAGLVFTWRNLRIAERNSQQTLDNSQQTLALSRTSQINDRFTKAIDQLGATNETGGKKLEVRLGGIYALEQIAKDSPHYYEPVMEVLTAYVREHAAWKGDTPRVQDEILPRAAWEEMRDETIQMLALPDEVQREQAARLLLQRQLSLPMSLTNIMAHTQRKQFLPMIATDIQAILTILKRRAHTFGKGEAQRLNLAGVALRRASFLQAHLEGALLVEAHLEEALLAEAHLEGAFLTGAHLEEALLAEAHLEEALLLEAHLEKAYLFAAHLEKADLGEAHLEWANLGDAHLEGANLRRAHLERASLFGTHLEGANLDEAHLEGAFLIETHLGGAILRGVQLQKAIELTVDQLSTVKTLYQAQLDPPLFEQIQKQYPHLLKEPSRLKASS